MARNDGPAVATAEIPSTSASNIAETSADSMTATGREEKEKEQNKEENRQSTAEDQEQGESSLEEAEQEEEEGEEEEGEEEEDSNSAAPPLPDEEVPPLPEEAPPGQVEDDGWEPVWDGNVQAYYFYNRITGLSQWENPRIPTTSSTAEAPTGGNADEERDNARDNAVGATASGYNPAIHGDYDPSAPYAQQYEHDAQANAASAGDQLQPYVASGAFNRFTGRWQDSTLAPDNFNDENKSRRQMHAFFDVDAAANSHDGRSLKAERSGKKLTKSEVKAFREKRRERKEEKRRAWLRD